MKRLPKLKPHDAIPKSVMHYAHQLGLVLRVSEVVDESEPFMLALLYTVASYVAHSEDPAECFRDVVAVIRDNAAFHTQHCSQCTEVDVTQFTVAKLDEELDNMDGTAKDVYAAFLKSQGH